MSDYFKRRFGGFWEMEKHGYNENPEETPRPPPPPIIKAWSHRGRGNSNASEPKSSKRTDSGGE